MRMYQAYGKYRKSRDAAWQCLIDCRAEGLPVPVSSIAAKIHVDLHTYGDNAGLLRQRGYAPLLAASGFTYADPDGHMLIFFNEEAPRPQIRFTIAHELGHILLGHMGQQVPRSQLLLPSSPKLEPEADRFALRLLAPACALWRMGAFSAGEIAHICDIPPDLAKVRAERMALLHQRGAWLTSPLERQLCRQMGYPLPEEDEKEDHEPVRE